MARELNAAEQQLCDNFRAVRMALGLTLEQIADITKISPASLSLIERRQQPPSLKITLDYCFKLKINEEHFRAKRITVQVA